MHAQIATPLWLRRGHPIVQRYLRQRVPLYFHLALLVLTIGLFLMLGGLSLPVLYCLLSLLILIHIALSSANKVYFERQASTWDLVRMTPLTPRELLLSLWMASVRQLNRTWLMALYRLVHGATIVGLIVYTLLFFQTPPAESLLILLTGTLLIVVQPFTEMYFSGMVGLAGANRLRDRGNAHGLVVGIVLLYWLAGVGGVLGLLWIQNMRLTSPQLIIIFLLPVLLPVVFGFVALRIAESALR